MCTSDVQPASVRQMLSGMTRHKATRGLGARRTHALGWSDSLFVKVLFAESARGVGLPRAEPRFGLLLFGLLHFPGRKTILTPNCRNAPTQAEVRWSDSDSEMRQAEFHFYVATPYALPPTPAGLDGEYDCYYRTSTRSKTLGGGGTACTLDHSLLQ